MHSVFDKAINIGDARGELFTLASRGVGNGPNTLVVDGMGFGATDIAAGDAVNGDGRALDVGSRLTVLLANAQTWVGAVLIYPGSDDPVPANVEYLRGILDQHGRPGGMVEEGGRTGDFARVVTALLKDRAALLVDALQRADFHGAGRHARSMIGLGPGLTPSGDDFLVGLLAVLHVADHPCRAWLVPVAAAIAQAGTSTNDISFAALSMAAVGRVREAITALVGDVMHGTRQGVAEAAHRVLAIGSTSGTDVVTGVLAAFESLVSIGSIPGLAFKSSARR
ncbi:MAG: DUF2877 domain-containing protein [Caldimonas sp.]